METVANESVSDVHGRQLNITVSYNDGRDDGIQASAGLNQLSRRSDTCVHMYIPSIVFCCVVFRMFSMKCVHYIL